MRIEFTIPGEPRGKGRPKFARIGGFVKTYTPSETSNYEDRVRLFFCAEYPAFVAIKRDVPLSVVVQAKFAIPKGWSKKRREAQAENAEPCLKKPDADNIGKIVCDALNGLAYEDDASVAVLTVSKAYAEKPEVRVIVEAWDTTDGEP